VLCTDKTGTLTENRMTIVELRLKDGNAFRPQDGTQMPAQLHDLSEFGLLASAPEPFDPMERAFHTLARERLTEASYRHPHWKLVHAYGLRPDLLAVTHIWQAEGDRREYIVASKGAPEAIAGLCRLSAADRAAMTQSIDAMASAGLRVLGVARASHAGPPWPASPRELGFEFLGLVGLADPLRASVVEAVRERRSAGIKAVMITGDYPATATAMVTDPVCSLVFEAETEEDDVMRRPPRSPDEPLFSRALVAWSLLQGLLAFAVVAAVYVAALRWGMPVPEVRALTFFSLIVVIVSLILVNRSFSASLLAALRRPNRTLAAVLAAVAVILALAMFWPFANQLFAFGPPPRRRSRPDARCRRRRAARAGIAEAATSPAAAFAVPAKPAVCDGSNAQADGTLTWFRKRRAPWRSRTFC